MLLYAPLVPPSKSSSYSVLDLSYSLNNQKFLFNLSQFENHFSVMRKYLKIGIGIAFYYLMITASHFETSPLKTKLLILKCLTTSQL